MNHQTGRTAPAWLLALVVVACSVPGTAQTPATRPAGRPAAETIGGGTVDSPAVGPPPSFGIGGPGMVLVKNWHFGTAGTVRNYDELSASFAYHDQFNTIGNGTHYGALTVAHNAATALPDQPVEGVDCPPVRAFRDDSLKTFLTGLDGATLCKPKAHNAGCGSFMAKWTLPRGGPELGRDIVWETRVRYETPPYFWFAIWTAGNKWKWDHGAQGAEHDLVESFGYDNGGPFTNFDGRYWHSNAVASPGRDAVDYKDWHEAMAAQGVKGFDPARYHVWTWHYKRDGTYAMYVDGTRVQSGSGYHWTYGHRAADEPIDVVFLFDGGWGHTQVASVDRPLPASAFAGKFYEWNYSRVYLSRDGRP